MIPTFRSAANVLKASLFQPRNMDSNEMHRLKGRIRSFSSLCY